MEFFAVLPIRKNTEKMIVINDTDHTKIGYVQRKYKSAFDEVLNHLPLSFRSTTNIIGSTDEYSLKIKEQSFKSNLFKLKWDVYITSGSGEEVFLLEDRTKVSTNPRMLYHKSDKGYVFKRDSFNRTCYVYLKDSSSICAQITIEKLVPTHLKIVVENNNLSVIEILGIYYIMTLVY